MKIKFPLFTLFLYRCLNKRPKSRGSLLILSLWMVALLSALALSISYGIRQKIILVRRLDEKKRLSHLAEGAIAKAISYLKKRTPTGYVGMNGNLINNPFEFKDMDFGQDYVSFSYNFFDDASGKVLTFYGFRDEASKININRTEPLILKRLFLQLGLDEARADEIASSISDWQDADNILCSPNSAEDSSYRFMEPSYEAKDSDFEVLEELLLIKGMDRGIFSIIKEYLTIHSDGKININTASAVVLKALGLNEDLVDKIIAFRAGEDRISGTEDDNVFVNLEEIVLRLKGVFDLSRQEIEQLKQALEKYLSVDSAFFSINCLVQAKEAVQKSVVTAVVTRDGKILFWQES